MGFNRRRIKTNGIELDTIDEGDGAPVILSHGFPETSYSWRHQVPALRDAGYRVLAPDQRGYGASSVPKDVGAYDILQLSDDLIGLLDDIGEEKGVFVGHDWGALIVWQLALLHPERVRAVVGMSVPFIRWPAPPTQLFEAASGGNFFYILYFQTVGPAEKELEADPRRTMARVLWGASGDGAPTMPQALPREGTGFLDMMSDPPADLPAGHWLTDEVIDAYAAAFKQSGFFGPVSYYRNFDRDWELTHEIPSERVSMPSFFIAGEKDGVVAGNPASLEAMKSQLPDLRGAVLVPGAGHWVQQEAPDATNDALLGFLGGL